MNLSLIDYGREAEVYEDGQGNAYKVFKSLAVGSVSAAREEHALGAARAHGYPVPEPRGRSIARDGRAVLKMEFLKGCVPLAEQLPFQPGVGTIVGDKLGELHALLHQKCLSVPHVPMAASIFSAAAARHNLAEVLSLGQSAVLCHGDFHSDNVLDGLGGPYVIDWANAFVGPPEADVATTVVRLRCVELGGGPTIEEEARFRDNVSKVEQAYLAAYLRRMSPNRSVVEQWVRLVAATTLSSVPAVKMVLAKLISGAAPPLWP